MAEMASLNGGGSSKHKQDGEKKKIPVGLMMNCRGVRVIELRKKDNCQQYNQPTAKYKKILQIRITVNLSTVWSGT